MERHEWQLFERYQAGECTPEEANHARTLLASQPQGAAFSAIVRAVDPVVDAPPAPDAAAAYQRWQAQMSRASTRRGIQRPRRVWPYVLGPTLALAGLAIAFIPHTNGVRVDSHTYRTVAGQQATVTLRDQARVVLAPATTLTVYASHDQTTVTVTGQALFTVPHANRTPFIVRAGSAITSVLGTTFDVRHYTTDRTTRVVVVDGRVALRTASSASANVSMAASLPGLVLTARMAGTVPDSGAIHVTPNIAVDDYTAWTTGQLVFQQTPVQEIVTTLGRVYAADIRIPDSALAQRRLTWTVSAAHRSLAGVLDALAVTLDAHIVQINHHIVLTPGRAASRLAQPSRAPFTPSLNTEASYGR